MRRELLAVTDRGLYCEAGDFYIDPWRPVARAVITHAHADHARWGMRRYLCAREGAGVLRLRVGPDAAIDTLEYGEAQEINGVRVSLHPAGHILGSAQVRVEHRGEVWVVSGDYKTEPDPTCTPFEPVRCHTFITESTFGLPIYRWPPTREVADAINDWWRTNAERGRASLLFGYALGKAQRMLAMLDPSIGPIALHGALVGLTDAYRQAGIELPPASPVSMQPKSAEWRGAMVLAPPSANGTPWMRRFGELSTGFASGWMAIRGARRRRAVDRGFVLSDHVDWPSLMEAIAATGCERVRVTHGYSAAVVRYLREIGYDARALETPYEGEGNSAEENLESERPETENSA